MANRDLALLFALRRTTASRSASSCAATAGWRGRSGSRGGGALGRVAAEMLGSGHAVGQLADGWRRESAAAGRVSGYTLS
jgi:hypothetical protein